MGRRPHLFVSIRDENASPDERRVAVSLASLGVGRTGGHLLAHLLDHLLDVAGISQDPLQSLHEVSIVADVAFHDADGVVEDVVHGKRHGTMDGFDALGCSRGLFGHEEFERVEGGGHIAGEDFEKPQVGFGKSTGLGAFDVEGPDHLLVQHEGHCERAFCPFAALQIERIFGGVVAEIAAARGGHVAGHAVVFAACIQDACLGLGLHADRQQRLESACLSVEQSDLDDVELQQILGVVEDVALEEFDPFLDRHIGQFGRCEIGELLARLMNGSKFLLLEDRVGDIANRRHGDRSVCAGRGLQMEVAVVGRSQRRACRAARSDRHAEGAGVGSEYFRAVECLKKVEAVERGLAAPFRQTTVGPDDGVVCADQRDAIREVLQDGPGITLPGQSLAHGGWNWIRHQRLSAHRLPLGSMPPEYKIR